MEARTGNDASRDEARREDESRWIWRAPASGFRAGSTSGNDERLRVVIDVARRAFGRSKGSLGRRA